MEEQYRVGLDVSKGRTSFCVRLGDGAIERVCEVLTDPNAIHDALADLADSLVRVALEIQRMANWPHGELTCMGLPAICVDARLNAANTIRGLLASFGLRVPAQPQTNSNQ